LGYDSDSSRPLQPYKLIFDYLPAWDAIRSASRLNVLISLGLALLAAAGAHQLIGALRRRSEARGLRPRALPVAAAIAVVAVVVLEGSGYQVRDGGIRSELAPPVPAAPAGQRDAPAPQLHLPFAEAYPFGFAEFYVYWSTDGFPEIANGWAGFLPRSDVRFYRAAMGFPSARSLARLRGLGIRTVIVHPDLAAGTPLAKAASRPLEDLPLRRERTGDVVLFHLEPA